MNPLYPTRMARGGAVVACAAALACCALACGDSSSAGNSGGLPTGQVGGSGGGDSADEDSDPVVFNPPEPEYDPAIDTATRFGFKLLTARISPDKGEPANNPWDWNGSLPGWVQDLIVEAVELWKGGQAANLTDLLLTYAPELLDGVVPPDPKCYGLVWVDPQDDASPWLEYDPNDEIPNDYEPDWSETPQRLWWHDWQRYPDSAIVIYCEDQDLLEHDPIGGVLITQEVAREMARLGRYVSVSEGADILAGQMLEMVLEVDYSGK